MLKGYTKKEDFPTIIGPGTLEVPDEACTYEGWIKDSKPHGYGEATPRCQNCYTYRGDWVDGL